MEGLAKLSKNGVGFGRRVLAVGSPFQVTREIYAKEKKQLSDGQINRSKSAMLESGDYEV
ncbi:hypothetical protein BpHYR1_043604 [Brachionus plicatilis]|uniref:Uncharacterized protein n=1 Tax=Brachionus plicatilis TaxID=10195 RepID=A0A3M7T7W0_BRAPC|nr:hypothetical protein BpHYR1_043604 [Brachionus plicatilis]